MIQARVSRLQLVLALVGLVASFYALFLHIQNFLRPGHGALCDISTTINCSSVVSSRYGELFSIPLGAYGMAYFSVLAVLAVLPKIAPISARHHALWQLGLGVLGSAGAVMLFCIAHFVLHTLCLTCLTVQITIILYALASVVHYRRHRQALATMPFTAPEEGACESYGTRFFALSLCVAIPPLAAGLVAGPLLDMWLPPPVAAVAASQPAQLVTPAGSPLPVTPAAPIKRKPVWNKTPYAGHGEDYRRGQDDAPVVVEVFSDFGCPHCKEATSAMVQAQNEVGLDKVLVVYRFFPLSSQCNHFVEQPGWYPYSCILVTASRCAGMQGKFWEFKDWAFSGQEWTDDRRAQAFSPENLKQQAVTLGMDGEAFAGCLVGHGQEAKIQEDATLAHELKIQGTPLILINGEQYFGVQTTEDFVSSFQKALRAH